MRLVVCETRPERSGSSSQISFLLYMVLSRTVFVPWDKTGALCPVGDLFNYIPPGTRVKSEINTPTELVNIAIDGAGDDTHSNHDDQVIANKTLNIVSKPRDSNDSRENYDSIEEINANDDFHHSDSHSGSKNPNENKISNENYRQYGDEDENDGVGSVDEEDDGFDVQIGNLLVDGEFVESCNSYVFYANQNYEKGDQVYLCYGKYRNLELLEIYGFVLNDNVNDEIDINLLDLKKYHVPGIHFGDVASILATVKGRNYLRSDGKCSFCLMASLRLLASPPHRRKQNVRFVMAGNMLSVENEMLAYACLLHDLLQRLRDLPTSMVEDLRILMNSSDKSSELVTCLDALGNLKDPWCESGYLSTATRSIHSKPNPLDSILHESENLRERYLKNFTAMFEDVKDRDASHPRHPELSEKMQLSIRWRALYKRTLILGIRNCCSTISRLRKKLVCVYGRSESSQP